MDSIYQANAIQTPPPMPTGETSKGHPTNGSPTAGIPATIVGARWFDMITYELINVALLAGIGPDGEKKDQLALAIQTLISKEVGAARAELSAAIDDVQQSLARGGVPTGTIFAFDRDTPPDEFWLPCDGRAVSRTSYADLFQAIGTRHGAGNGSTTFNLPNLVGRVLEGANSGVGQLVAAQVPNPRGRIANFNAYTTRATPDGAFYAVHNGGFVGIRQGSWDAANEIFFDASRVSSVYKDGVDTVKVDGMKVLYCIHI